MPSRLAAFIQYSVIRCLTAAALLAPPCLSAPAAAATLNVPAQYATIQAAIDASANGDTVLIGDGTYTGSGNVDLDFGGKSLTVTSQNGAAKTVIDCQGTASANHRGFSLHRAETNAIISGLTVKSGYETGSSGDPAGGGVAIASGVNATLGDCVFSGNVTTAIGGGVFSSGTATLTRCAFLSNSASYGGGGACNNGTMKATNCIFKSNSTGNRGGGLYNFFGGSLTLTNCTASGNGAGAFGGVYADNGGVILVNDIFSGDMGVEIGQGMATASYCDIRGGYPGSGNIDADPLFVQPASAASLGDLHLQAASPCLGAGTASGAPTTTIDGRARPVPPSMGAYELPMTSTATVLVSSLNPAAAGANIIYTATVTGTSKGAVPTGTVTFTLDGTAQTPVPVGRDGTASYTASFAAVGTHAITAAYSGDANFGSSTSSTLTQTVNSAAAATVTLRSSLNPSAVGQSVTFSAYVGDYRGTPSGYVTFTVDNVSQPPVAISNGYYAAYSTSSLAVGSHSVTVAYSGDAKYGPANSGTLTQTVIAPVSTTTALTSSLNPSQHSQQVTFTATVMGNSPTGTVTLTDTTSTTVLGTGNVSAGVATFSTTDLSGGSHQIVASYNGDTGNNASASPALTQTVSQESTTATLTSSLNPALSGQNVIFRASIRGAGGAASGYPTGTVTYTIDGTALPPVGANQSYATSSLAVGSHTVSVSYSGDSSFTASTSAPLTQSVIAHVSPQYVSPSGSDGNDGSQAMPKLTIQAAINATLSGDTVIIKDGTYTGPGNVDLDFGRRNITVTSQSGAVTTIIDCGGSSNFYHRAFGVHDVTGAAIRGLTIQNGYMGSSQHGGGGIYNVSAGLLVQDCIIRNNYAANGGGIDNQLNSTGSVTITNCIITGNSTGSSGFGGGVYNESYNGGGGGNTGGTVKMTHCTITANTATYGGGIYNFSGVKISEDTCLVSGNAALAGGGIYNTGYNYGKIEILNCVLTSNTAQSNGGGIYTNPSYSPIVVTNCTLSGNSAPSGGAGGIYCYSDVYSTSSNTGNSLTNDILYGDTEGELGGSGNTATYCDIQGGYVGTGNIDADPLFVSATDLHLRPGSPCFGAGTADGAPATDADGRTRANPPSIGAYEGVPAATQVMVGNVSGAAGAGVTLSATLGVTGGAALSGRTVAFRVDGAAVGTAVTGGTGVASLSYAIPAGAMAGSHVITVSFGGDAADAPASGTGTLTVTAPTPAGQVRFFPRLGYSNRMVGGVFQGSQDGTTWAALATVSQTPAGGRYTALPTSLDPKGFRFLRYLAPNSSYGNVAEVEFDSGGVKLTGSPFGTPGSYADGGNTFLSALDGDTNSFFDAPYPGTGDYVGIDRNAPSPTYTKLTGTLFGTPGSYADGGNTFLNVFDGSAATFFDAPYPGTGDYAGLDLGTGHAAAVTRIGFFPRLGYEGRMVGGVFQGSQDGTTWAGLYTVTAAPASGVMTQVTSTSDGTPYRYLRYLAPDNSYGNVAEIEFDTSP